jgi:hypothetical protein
MIAAAALTLVVTAGVLAVQAATGCGIPFLSSAVECRLAGGPPPAPSPVAPTNGPMGPFAGEIPANANCAGCHVAADGSIGTHIPAIGHPLEGWRVCTACHAPARLVTTAPGHTGIHEDQCLVCHTKTTPLPPARPHAPTRNKGCFDCHGTTAPLPADMSHRDDTTCWLCHRATQIMTDR